MKYYHGSPFLFEQFDISLSNSNNNSMQLKSISLAFSKKSAKQYAFKNDNKIGYIYTVKVIGDDSLDVEENDYGYTLFNVGEILTIINVEKVVKE
jgi:hypothetical protein